jgi:hypothetical protein
LLCLPGRVAGLAKSDLLAFPARRLALSYRSMSQEETYTITDLAREFGITPRAIRFTRTKAC